MNCPGCDSEMIEENCFEFCDECGIRAPSANCTPTEIYFAAEGRLNGACCDIEGGGSTTILGYPVNPTESE